MNVSASKLDRGMRKGKCFKFEICQTQVIGVRALTLAYVYNELCKKALLISSPIYFLMAWAVLFTPRI